MSTASSTDASLPAIPASARLRWKAPLVILAVAGLLYTLSMQFMPEEETYRTFLQIYVMLPATVLAMLIWWSFFSGLSRAGRGRGVGVLAGAAALFVLLVRTDGVDGVMVPHFSWRWTKSTEQRAAEFREAEAASRPALATSTAAATANGKANGDDASASGDAGETVATAVPTTVSAEPVVIAEADWPRFRGANSDSTVHGITLRRDWNDNPPAEVWRRPCGLGWSSFAVVGSRLYTQEQLGKEEAVVCYDADSGRELWRHTDPVRLDTSLGGDGPRATPTIDDSKVFALGGTGILNCLDAATGAKIWSADIIKDAGINGIGDAWVDWGMAGSPLLDDKHVYVNPGIDKSQPGDKDRDKRTANGAVAAYDRHTGKRVWGSGNSKTAYTSPMFARFGGEQHLVIFDAEECAGYDPATGKRLWAQPFPTDQRINVAQPFPVGDDSLVISAGYGAGSLRFQVLKGDKGWSVKEAWTLKNAFKLKFNDGVLRDGHVYGLDEGVLACLDVATGKRVWRQGRYRYGEIVLVAGTTPADDLLVVLTETGDVVLVKPSPQAPEELGRFKAIGGTCWNHPVVNRGRIYVRSEEEMACFEAGVPAK